MLGNAQVIDSSRSEPSTVPLEDAHERRGRCCWNDQDTSARDNLTSRQAYCLYLSHSLSMWNSRMYEFAVILFIQAAFPGNLTASSINGIAETVCVLLFSSALGRWVDRAPSRLRTLILTIVTDRITVLASCITWFLILSLGSPFQKHFLFAIALLLGMAEKLSRAANILSMERDWVPTLANSSRNATVKAPYDLTHLNTALRRIDLLCKLVAPLAVSTFISAVGSERVAVTVVAAISTLSWGPECWSVQRVWNQNSRLRGLKETFEHTLGGLGQGEEEAAREGLDGRTKAASERPPIPVQKFISKIKDSSRTHRDGLRYYFASPVCIPSICAAIPHASVLTFSGTMITCLLNDGFSLNWITGAKASGAIFEMGSTFLFPWAVGMLSRNRIRPGWFGKKEYEAVEMQEPSSQNPDWHSDTDEQAVESKEMFLTIECDNLKTVGWYALGGLFLSLIPALLSLFYISPTTLPPTILLIASISVSLLFRWTYDLSATQLTQALIPAAHRSSFGGTEMAIISVLSLAHWVAAGVWHAERQFWWLATGSFALVGVAVAAYTVWYRRNGIRVERDDQGSPWCTGYVVTPVIFRLYFGCRT